MKVRDLMNDTLKDYNTYIAGGIAHLWMGQRQKRL